MSPKKGRRRKRSRPDLGNVWALTLLRQLRFGLAELPPAAVDAVFAVAAFAVLAEGSGCAREHAAQQAWVSVAVMVVVVP